MKTMHHAYKKIMKIMICILENGRLQNDFMRNLSSHQKVAAKVEDDHQILSVTTQEANSFKTRVVRT